MDSSRIDLFILINGKHFESHHLPLIRERLVAADDSKWAAVQVLQFKDPTFILIVSLLAGGLGVDRFLLGDTGMGVGKLITCGGFGIWTIIDWFMIMGVTREKNLEKLRFVLA